MEGALTQFADSLAPSEAYLSKGKQVMDRLFRVLQADGQYKIDRLRLAGSLEKKTSVKFAPDHDVVAFLNDVDPNRDVLGHYKGVIRKAFNLTKKKIKIAVRSLQFKVEGIEFDLLFARNMVKTHTTDPTRQQHAALLQNVSTADDPYKTARKDSAGLTEAAVEFVKIQSPFVHKVARLAKYWSSTIYFPYLISARSSIFELIGITAGREEEKAHPHDSSIGRAFKGFLEKVATLKSQNIVYYEFYNETDVPRKVLKKRPLILDPSSPYNNFMLQFPGNAIRLFSACATESLQMFQTDVLGSIRMHEGIHKDMKRFNKRTKDLY